VARHLVHVGFAVAAAALREDAACLIVGLIPLAGPPWFCLDLLYGFGFQKLHLLNLRASGMLPMLLLDFLKHSMMLLLLLLPLDIEAIQLYGFPLWHDCAR
jgi:hypothetical protein